ncbi:MAG: hypothetical protein LBJ59_08365 [Zoogloeaceae bacterium]|jgi:hypothetical protein|nr:hypothetical protein [Zoogloeaceae bacterium]
MTEKLLLYLVKEIARETDLMEQHKITPIAKNLVDNRQNILSNLKAIGRSGNLETIIAAEKFLVENDIKDHANSKSMFSSLNDALEELRAVETHVEMVSDPKEYQRVNKTNAQHKMRDTRDLPKDGARHAFRSHDTRLGNLDRGRVDDHEKAIIQARRHNIRIAEKRYIERQEKTLGRELEEQPAPDRARHEDPSQDSLQN